MAIVHKTTGSITNKVLMLVINLFLFCSSPVGAMNLSFPVNSCNFVKTEVPVRAPLVEYTFVNTALKGLSSLTYGKLAADNEVGLDDLEREGHIDLFFRGTSRLEANFAGLVTQIDNRLIVAFPGTRLKHSVASAISDIATDAKVCGDDGGFSEILDSGNVHPGFAGEVIEFWPNLESCLRRHSGYQEVFFTGHSKGGAVALLSAFKYAHEHQAEIKSHPNFVKVFTFSAPAVFSEKGRSLFHSYVDGRNIICIYKNNDIVPVSSMPFSFVHAGISANISSNQSLVEDATAEVRFLVENLSKLLVHEGVDTEALMALTKRAISTILDSHCLDGLSTAQIREVIERVKGNYWKNPSMDLNAMGRDSSWSCNVM